MLSSASRQELSRNMAQFETKHETASFFFVWVVLTLVMAPLLKVKEGMTSQIEDPTCHETNKFLMPK